MDDLDQIGDTVIDSVAAYFKAARNVRIVDNLKKHVDVLDAEQPTLDSPISGKTVVFTGTLEKMTREEAKRACRAARRQGERQRFQENRLRRRGRRSGLETEEGGGARRHRARGAAVHRSREGKLSWLPERAKRQTPAALICEAIRKRVLLQFHYHGRLRVVAPYCFGVSARDADVLRAIQVRGQSSSGGGLGFGKLWTVADMVGLNSSTSPSRQTIRTTTRTTAR